MEFAFRASVFYCALCCSILIQVECNIKTKTVTESKGSKWEAPKDTVTTNSKWIQASLDKHNFYRDRHRVPRLTLNNTLSEISQAWCNNLLRKGMESFNRTKSIEFFDHNHDVLRKASLGENLYYAVNYAPDINASFPVRLWYEEVKDYDFVTGKRKSTSHPKAQIGHLTQLIWKSTTQMGTSRSTAKLYNGQTLTFVCANYYPAGNIYVSNGFKERLYLENVLPGLDKENNDLDYELDENSEIIPIRWPGLGKAKVSTENSWTQIAIDTHNKHRKNHGVEELKLNPELCEISQYWSNFLLKSGIISFNNHKRIETFSKNDQTGRFGIGENLMYFLTDGSVISSETAVNLWYQERQYYDFEKGKKRVNVSRSSSTEQFTQVVWKSTAEVCMTYSSSKLENGQTLTFIVANYYPSKYAAGVNWERNCLDNVPKPNSAMSIFSTVKSAINFVFITFLLFNRI